MRDLPFDSYVTFPPPSISPPPTTMTAVFPPKKPLPSIPKLIAPRLPRAAQVPSNTAHSLPARCLFFSTMALYFIFFCFFVFFFSFFFLFFRFFFTVFRAAAQPDFLPQTAFPLQSPHRRRHTPYKIPPFSLVLSFLNHLSFFLP